MDLYDLLGQEDSVKSVLLAILCIDTKVTPNVPDGWMIDLGYSHDGRYFVWLCISDRNFFTKNLISINLSSSGLEAILGLKIGGTDYKYFYYIDDILKDHPDFVASAVVEEIVYYQFSMPREFAQVVRKINSIIVDENNVTDKFKSLLEVIKDIDPKEIADSYDYGYMHRLLSNMIKRTIPPLVEALDEDVSFEDCQEKFNLYENS